MSIDQKLFLSPCLRPLTGELHFGIEMKISSWREGNFRGPRQRWQRCDRHLAEGQQAAGGQVGRQGEDHQQGCSLLPGDQ